MIQILNDYISYTGVWGYPHTPFYHFKKGNNLMFNLSKLFHRKAKTKNPEFEKLDTASLSKKICAVVDQNNIDSLLAFAKLYSNGFVSTVISYDKEKLELPIIPVDQYIILGTHVSRDHWDNIFTKVEKVTVFAYHGTYDDDHTTTNPKVIVLRPPSFDAIDNSVCAMLKTYCASQLESSPYDELMMPAAIYINGKHSIGNHTKRLDVFIKAKLSDAYQFLRDVVNNSKLNTIKDFVARGDEKSYLTKVKNIRKNISDRATNRVYASGGGYVTVLTMNVSDYNFRDTLDNVLMSRDSFVGYHDIGTRRIWRVYTTKPGEVGLLAKAIKPRTRWKEGSVHCMETILPPVS